MLLLVLSLSSLAPSAAEAVTARELQERYDLGRVRAGARRWTPVELTVLERSLRVLSREERKLLDGVDFVRGGLARHPREAGLFTWNKRGRRITVYGRAFRDGGDGPNWTVVHEVGHAIASRPLLEARAVEGKALARFNERVDSYNDAVRAYNRAARTANRTGRAADRDRAGRLRKRATSLQTGLASLRADALRARRAVVDAAKELRRRRPRSGVLGAFRRVLNGRPSPSRYGDTHIAEAFAESFAMFHCDPKGLRRDLPEVHAWFAAGGHLRD